VPARRRCGAAHDGRTRWAPRFANLADLLDPVAGWILPRLPEPQGDAMRAALGLTDADMPFRETLLERAVVAVVRGLAEAGVVVAIDDEQWMDADTPRLLEAQAAEGPDEDVAAELESSTACVGRRRAGGGRGVRLSW
jgi:hypothetical protein